MRLSAKKNNGHPSLTVNVSPNPTGEEGKCGISCPRAYHGRKGGIGDRFTFRARDDQRRRGERDGFRRDTVFLDVLNVHLPSGFGKTDKRKVAFGRVLEAWHKHKRHFYPAMHPDTLREAVHNERGVAVSAATSTSAWPLSCTRTCTGSATASSARKGARRPSGATTCGRGGTRSGLPRGRRP